MLLYLELWFNLEFKLNPKLNDYIAYIKDIIKEVNNAIIIKDYVYINISIIKEDVIFKNIIIIYY